MSDTDRPKHGDSCPECTLAPFTRNHYFTGKLMQVGDFDTEQRYGVDKLRLHDRVLHGWGVACGLKVTQHPQPACQSRMVCVEPGVAIDCCGREIVIGAEDCIDLTQLAAIKALIDQKDTKPHTLQICIKYRECPTEEVPVFYDDCGCDGDRCAPNRILESYEFDAIIDPKVAADSPGQPKLNWLSTTSPAGANGVVLAGGPPGYLYAISFNQNTVFQIETEHYSVVGTASLPAPGITLAVSPDGTRLYVVTQTGSFPSGNPFLLYVFDTTNNMALVNHFNIPDSDKGSSVSLAVGTDQRLLTLIGGSAGLLQVWPTSIAAASSPTSSYDSETDSKTKLVGLVISGDGTRAYAADTANNQIAVLNIQAGNGSGMGTPLTNLPSGFAPSELAVVGGAGPELLAVIGGASSASPQLTLVDPSGASTFGTVALAQSEVDLVVSPDGRWAYVLEADGNTEAGSIQTVDLAGLRLQKTVTAGQPVPLDDAPYHVAISPTGRTLYVASAGGAPQAGGIAIIDVSDTDCPDLLGRSLDGCPECRHPECIVLATIERYQAGFSVLDPTDPPSDPNTDTRNQIARIDNRKGRRLLPSVGALYDWFECIQANVVGKPGPPGPQGPQGVQGPQGLQGNPGPGLEQNLTRIRETSWPHNGTLGGFPLIRRISPQQEGNGLWITFTGPVSVDDAKHPILPDYVFQVLVRKSDTGPFENPWNSVVGVVFPVTVDPSTGNAVEVDMTQTPKPTPNAIAFFWGDIKRTTELIRTGNEFLVRLRGDFVVDLKGNAINAQFVRADFPTGRIPSGGPYGIQGGTFESWFQFKNPQAK